MLNSMVTQANEVLHLPVDCIRANPYQPRKFFERANLEELAASIREYGVLQPISVRLINGFSYELVAGERRLRASKLAGLATIPAILVRINDQESAILAIIENLQRDNLNYIEEAEGFANLIEDYGFTQEELARKIGKSQSTVANKIRLLKLPKALQNFLIESSLSERHARAVLRLENEEDQAMVLTRAAKESLTVSKTEALVEQVLEKKHSAGANKREFKRWVKDVRIFTNTIKNAVDIMNQSGVKAEYIVEENDGGMDIVIAVQY
ncbi:MAG: ParB/RepB/Spo0J family partition protein [Defluviitaleaceae bacterium]|nr:ParB/RepB/Spo0J family partition protein [Defluviitaleaceae bacterium]